jgi:carboxymethylenebutenolidase
MKKLHYLIAFIFVSTFAYGQSCCFVTKDEMQLMASNKAFQRSHKLPKPYHHISQAGGEMITFATPDGQQANAFFIKAAKPTNYTLFVFQEWWG